MSRSRPRAKDRNWRRGAKAAGDDGLLIEVHTDEGPVGVAYATAALHVGEAREGMRQVIEELFRPILIGSGAGSEVMRRIGAPMIGGMITAPLLSMCLLPAAYLLLRRPRAAKPIPPEGEEECVLQPS